MKASENPLSPHDARRIAAAAGVCPTTVQRLAAGRPIRSPQHAHILAAINADPMLRALIDTARASTSQPTERAA